MSFGPLITALEIPPQSLVEQRVPKKLLLDHGAPTAADKRQIQEGIGEIVWVAALKPTNIGIPPFQDELREYLEIAIVTVELRQAAKPSRLTELIHRAVPYPLVLITGQSEAVNLPVTLSLAHKRWSQGETGKVVVEEVRQAAVNLDAPSAQETAFLSSLGISRIKSRDLFTVYDGLLARLTALEAARITGVFSPPDSLEKAAGLRKDLDWRVRLQRELDLLRARAAKEKQLNRRVELNLEIRRLEATLKELIPNL